MSHVEDPVLEHLTTTGGTLAVDVTGSGPLVGAATIAAATAPELIRRVVELAPFTRAQSVSLGGLVRTKRYRAGSTQLGLTMALGSLPAWTRYLDLAYPTKPGDWDAELARITAVMARPDRMKALQAMCRSASTHAGAQLGNVRRPVLVVHGSLDPDWADPRAEGEKIVADLPTGLGELAVIDGAGHYPHAQTPERVLALALPFLTRTLPVA